MTETSGRQTGRDVEVKRAVSTFLLAPDLDYQQPYKSCPTKIIVRRMKSFVLQLMVSFLKSDTFLGLLLHNSAFFQSL